MAIVYCTPKQLKGWMETENITPERYYIVKSIGDDKVYIRPKVTTSRVNTFIISAGGDLPKEMQMLIEAGIKVVECDLYQLEEDRTKAV